ncbi:MAG TPA: xanthine dehydrogenase family protein molybdopterin-binding subunit, partial [Alphaproteobacteria bacterium]|nr:xanthine dehydrogenase family protein molybdopterin-binding subunit [Alphaproteobacteria bacterium]
MKFGTGQSVRRTEDVRFVTGHGQYTDDIRPERVAHAAVLRSPHAHAKVGKIDASEALKAPGVLAVITAADLEAAKVGPLQSMGAIPGDGGRMVPLANTPQPVLAKDRVRYAGAPVAFVIAETRIQARDAAELIEVDYEPLAAAGRIEAALKPDAPQIWGEAAPGNLCFTWEVGDEAGMKAAFAKAAQIADVTVYQNRVVPTSMEPRNALGDYDTKTGHYTLKTGTQGSNGAQRVVGGILGLKPEQLRVITPDVGGGFGMKGFIYPEQVLVLVAAKKVGRPVSWQADRSEAFLADSHGRGFDGRCRLALDQEGKILALDIDFAADLGAFKHQFGPFIPTLAGARIWGGVYKIPTTFARVRGVYTNTMGVDAYRGAGRPEGAYMIERLMTEAGRITGLGAVEIRKRNFIGPTDFPYKNWRGITYDSGDFAKNLDDCLQASRFAEFEKRRAQARAHGKLRGIGMSYYVEITGAGQERSEVRFTDNGGVLLIVGTQSNGQGHETTFAQILSEELDIPFDQITVIQGDTDMVPMGGGTGGSRSVV